MDEEAKPFTTSDTPLAAFLHMKGMALLSTIPDKLDDRRRVYVFMDEPDRLTLVEQFKDNQGGYYSYWVSLKTVQRKLHEG